MGVSDIFDPIVRAHFEDNGGADTGDLNIYVIPKSAVDTSKPFEIENFVMYKANVSPPADDLSNGVFIRFRPNTSNGGYALGLWNDTVYEDTREMGFGAILLEQVPQLFWVTNPEIADEYGVKIGLYVSALQTDTHIAILYPKA